MSFGYGNSADTQTPPSVIVPIRPQVRNIRFGCHFDGSPFSWVPLELRDIIYDALWHLDPIRRVRYNGDMVRLHYDDIGTEESPYKQGLPCWLLVNKAFLEEGMLRLNMSTMWVFETAPDAVPKSKSIFFRQAWIMYGYDARPNTQSLDLSKARGLTIRTREPMIAPVFEFGIPYRDRTHIARILATGLRLAVLRFRGVVEGSRGLHNASDWKLRLKWLEQFRHRLCVDRFEYEISGVEWLFDWDAHAAPPLFTNGSVWPQMQGAFEKEVERVGKLLVGGDGTLETTLLKEWPVRFGVSLKEVTCKMAYTAKNKKWSVTS